MEENLGPMRNTSPGINMNTCKTKTLLSWAFQFIAAAILFQTLFFKFTAAKESVYIFTTLGIEPWGRVASGMAELLAVVLLLVPRTVTLGALLSLGVISGALISHLTKLGIVVKDDGGLLFGLAVTVFISSIIILILRRQQIPIVSKIFLPAASSSYAATSCEH
jgi:putative oxidoreductase